MVHLKVNAILNKPITVNPYYKRVVIVTGYKMKIKPSAQKNFHTTVSKNLTLCATS